jgi:hypothetical protein
MPSENGLKGFLAPDSEIKYFTHNAYNLFEMRNKNTVYSVLNSTVFSLI